MTNEITFAKGGTTVTVETVEITENFKNKVIFIRPPQTKDNQASGAKTPKAIDLLMITRSFLIRGHISPTSGNTAVVVRDQLRTMISGGGVAGGKIDMVYGGDTISGYIEDLTMKEVRFDEPGGTLATNVAKFDISVTFI